MTKRYIAVLDGGRGSQALIMIIPWWCKNCIVKIEHKEIILSSAIASAFTSAYASFLNRIMMQDLWSDHFLRNWLHLIPRTYIFLFPFVLILRPVIKIIVGKILRKDKSNIAHIDVQKENGRLHETIEKQWDGNGDHSFSTHGLITGYDSFRKDLLPLHDSVLNECYPDGCTMTVFDCKISVQIFT